MNFVSICVEIVAFSIIHSWLKLETIEACRMKTVENITDAAMLTVSCVVSRFHWFETSKTQL